MSALLTTIVSHGDRDVRAILTKTAATSLLRTINLARLAFASSEEARKMKRAADALKRIKNWSAKFTKTPGS